MRIPPLRSRTVSYTISLLFTIALPSFDPRGTAVITPLPALHSPDANGQFLLMMDAHEMTAEVMLAGEGTTTVVMRTHERLLAVGVVGLEVGLQIVLTSKGSTTVRANVLLAGIRGLVVNRHGALIMTT